MKVHISKKVFPETAEHIHQAVRTGEAQLLHIDRPGAKENRKESLKGIPTRKGYDRDEYPPAMSREGGKGANVRYVLSSDNRGSGRSMGSQLAPYCNNQPFILITTP